MIKQAKQTYIKIFIVKSNYKFSTQGLVCFFQNFLREAA